MKGKFCNIDPGKFCQEASGCGACAIYQRSHVFQCPPDGPRVSIDPRTGEKCALCTACGRCGACAPGHIFMPVVNFGSGVM